TIFGCKIDKNATANWTISATLQKWQRWWYRATSAFVWLQPRTYKANSFLHFSLSCSVFPPNSNPKMAEKGKKNDESEKFVSAVLNVDLRCNCVGCIRRIRKTCHSLHGVTTVKEDVNANKLYVSGIFDPVKLRDKLQSSTPKKVELVSPAPPKKDEKKNGDPEAKSKTEQEKSKKEKEPAVTTVVLKMEWHCEGCTHKIHKIISTYNGVQRVQMDKAKELITVSTIAEPKQLAEFLQKKLKRKVQIVPEKKEKDEEKKQKQNEGGKKGGGSNGDKEEPCKDPKMEYFMVGNGYGYREAASGYVVDVFYAPQIFSEDNPNGCSVM
ncbi:hypothetical protein V2J09_018327, partial [Rumex salicifolius]